LDGLRAVAVLSVIAYHFGVEWAPGGFLGVDMFFVLSGYLITSLLVIEWGKASTIDLLAFWARRARRLLPALLLVLVAIAVWASISAHRDQLDGIRADSIWTLFYGANWHLIDSSQSYFATVREASPLRHTWSLAIEEQFYLVWPLLAFACLALGRGRRRLLAVVCGAGIVASSLWMTHLVDLTDRSRAYYGTDSRVGQLMVGALLGLALLHWSPRTRTQRVAVQGAGVLGAAVCLWFFVAVRDTDSAMYRGGFLVFGIATAALVAAVVQTGQTPLRAGLAWKPVVWIGAVSYGLYLWHWPVVVAVTPATLGRGGWELSATRLALTFAFAALSFYLVEQPIRYGSWSRGRTGIALAAGAGVATAVVIVVATAGGTPPPAYLVANPDKPVTRAAPAVAVVPASTESEVGVSRMLLVGDSVADSLGPALQAEAAARGVALTVVTRPGCGLTTAVPLLDDGRLVPWGGDCAATTAEYESQSVDEHAPDVVLWLSTWETSDLEVDGTAVHFGTAAGDAALLEQLADADRRLTARGARLVLVNVPRPADTSEVQPLRADEGTRRQHLNSLFAKYASSSDRVAIADLADIVCPRADACPATTADGVVLRPRDGNHFEGDGPGWVAPRLYTEITKALWALNVGKAAAASAMAVTGT
jgi:peptidoglycan/LPS O-acetylase OafA/YrhL